LFSREFEFGSVEAWKEGSVGWVAARGRGTNAEGDEWVPERFTAVLHEEGAYWRVVQWHTSVGVSNLEAFGNELTTRVDEVLTGVLEERPSVEAMGADGSVTIVFTDIEGSTSMMEALGEDKWFELVNWHERAVRQQTAIFGGTVVKNQGDGFMLAFPARESPSPSRSNGDWVRDGTGCRFPFGSDCTAATPKSNRETSSDGPSSSPRGSPATRRAVRYWCPTPSRRGSPGRSHSGAVARCR
jgi:hypothetical protein